MIKKIIIIITACVLLILAISGAYLTLGQNKATQEDISTLNEVSEYQDGYYEVDHNSENGFIFYPGAKVSPASYAYLTNIEDTNVYIAKFPFNFAFFKPNSAQDIINNENDVENWYIGGHSLGGVFAYEYAKKHEEEINGVVFLASYPASEIPENSPLEILSIYATNDGVVGDYSAKKEMFNEKTTFIEIEGGNHTQFGDYSLQKGDNQSNISFEEQHDIIVNQIQKFIN